MVEVTGFAEVAVGQEPRAELEAGRLAAAVGDLEAEALGVLLAEADAEADTDGDWDGDDAERKGEEDAEAGGEPALGPEADPVDPVIRIPPVTAPPTRRVATTPIRTVRRFVLLPRARRCSAALGLTW